MVAFVRQEGLQTLPIPVPLTVANCSCQDYQCVSQFFPLPISSELFSQFPRMHQRAVEIPGQQIKIGRLDGGSKIAAGRAAFEFVARSHAAAHVPLVGPSFPTGVRPVHGPLLIALLLGGLLLRRLLFVRLPGDAGPDLFHAGGAGFLFFLQNLVGFGVVLGLLLRRRLVLLGRGC